MTASGVGGCNFCRLDKHNKYGPLGGSYGTACFPALCMVVQDAPGAVYGATACHPALCMAAQHAPGAVYGGTACSRLCVWRHSMLPALCMAAQHAPGAVYGGTACYRRCVWRHSMLPALCMAAQHAPGAVYGGTACSRRCAVGMRRYCTLSVTELLLIMKHKHNKSYPRSPFQNPFVSSLH